MKELFEMMFLLDNPKPDSTGEWVATIILYLFWIPFAVFITLFVFPIFLLTTPLRLLHSKLEEEAANEYVGKW